MSETPFTPKHYGDHRPQTVWAPPMYRSDLTGRGRWCRLYATGSGEVIGVLWTDDKAILGWEPAGTDAGWAHGGLVLDGLREGAAVGAPTTRVFDHWAGTATQAINAGPVTSGALEAMPGPDEPDTPVR